MANFKNDEEMSMEDILSSIRRYVSEEDGNKASARAADYNDTQGVQPGSNTSDADNNVISLGQEDVANTSDVLSASAPVESTQENFDDAFIRNNTKNNWTDENYKNNSSPFNKLAEALKTYGKHKRNVELSLDMSVEQFLRTVVENYLQKWMNANLNKIVEDIVRREIDRIKSE